MVIEGGRTAGRRLFNNLVSNLGAILPSEAAPAGPGWGRRHRAVLVVLWGQVLAVLAADVGLRQHYLGF